MPVKVKRWVRLQQGSSPLASWPFHSGFWWGFFVVSSPLFPLLIIFSDSSLLLCSKATRWQRSCWLSSSSDSHQGESPGFRSMDGCQGLTNWDQHKPQTGWCGSGEAIQNRQKALLCLTRGIVVGDMVTRSIISPGCDISRLLTQVTLSLEVLV